VTCLIKKKRSFLTVTAKKLLEKGLLIGSDEVEIWLSAKKASIVDLCLFHTLFVNVVYISISKNSYKTMEISSNKPRLFAYSSQPTISL
jgi:hypothetical protein